MNNDTKDMNQIFSIIRNYLTGRVIGISRDRALLHEVVKCLFCKAALIDKHIQFEDPTDLIQVSKTYRHAFAALKQRIPNLFEPDDEMLLDPDSIAYVDGELNHIDFANPHADPLGELYQAFIASDMRMAEGQFFTPGQAIMWLVEAIDPQPGETIIDPACGAGGFLSYVARKFVSEGIERKVINEHLYGIEKDEYLAHLANAHITLVTLQPPNIVCADSIEAKTRDGHPLPFTLHNSFDVVLTNPPFGAKIKTGSENIRRKFDLAYKWKIPANTSQMTFLTPQGPSSEPAARWKKTAVLKTQTSPQILFTELCLKLLKPGGRMGIVVPESLVTSRNTGYVVEYLLHHANLISVVGMPESLFKTSGKGGTHTKTCLLVLEKKQSGHEHRHTKIFMAEAKWCGHDSRGNRIPHNDLPEILSRFQQRDQLQDQNELGYFITCQEIQEHILAPRYYNPDVIKTMKRLTPTHHLVSVKELVSQGILSFNTGDEIGKLSYGTGDIPFVRTSDISNWEIKLDTKHGVSEEIYQQYVKKQDVREGDILMVRDGTYLIGKCAYISKYDVKMLYQSHLYKIRVAKTNFISPFLLLAVFSSKPVLEQILAKRLTQDIIDSIGNRVYELVLPIPKDEQKKQAIEEMVARCICERIEARELARKAKDAIIHLDL